MEMKQLQYFVTTVQVGSITRAAEVLYITQPALTRILRRMEAELGFSLFERKHSGLLLTPAGREFAQCAENILQTLESGVRSSRQKAGLESDTMSITCAYHEFPNEILYDFQEHYPNIRIRFSLYPPEEAQNQLLTGAAVYAILPRGSFPESIKWMPLLKEELMLSFPKGHPLCGRAQVSLQELDGLDIICDNLTFDEDRLNEALQQHGISMNIRFSGNDHDQVGMLKYTMNSAILVPVSALTIERQLNEDMRKRFGAPVPPARIDPPIFQREIGVAFHANHDLLSADLYLVSSLKNHYTAISQKVSAYLACR